MKFAIVAPVVRTPPHDCGSPNSSFNQPSAIDSRCPPSGVATQAPGFWSHVEVSQSAPRAAGVVPPLTKWKNFGPAECTSPPPPSINSCKAAIAPTPSSGSDPTKDAAASSAWGSRTGRSSTASRYFRASSATKARTASSSSAFGGVGDIARRYDISGDVRALAASRAHALARRWPDASHGSVSLARARAPPSRVRG